MAHSIEPKKSQSCLQRHIFHCCCHHEYPLTHLVLSREAAIKPLNIGNCLTFLETTGTLSNYYSFLGLTMTTTKAEPAKKAKTTVYMTEEEETLLNELFIKRLREKRKTDKSALFCEGIKILFEKEIGSSQEG